MADLHAGLRELLERHRHSEIPEVQDLVRDLELTIDAAAPVYEYRKRPSWVSDWKDLTEGQVPLALGPGYEVERRLAPGDWEAVTEIPRV
jgi:hypothetical protein